MDLDGLTIRHTRRDQWEKDALRPLAFLGSRHLERLPFLRSRHLERLPFLRSRHLDLTSGTLARPCS